MGTGLFVMQGWPKEHVPWRGEKGVFVALEFIRAGAGRFFQHLRLAAMMVDLRQEPEIIPRFPRMFLDPHEVSADEGAFIAAAFCHAVVGAVALKGASGQMLAVVTGAETAGIVIVLEHRALSIVEVGLQ